MSFLGMTISLLATMSEVKMFTEKMPCKYTLEKDLHDRLDNTLCRYNGKIVYVRTSGATLKLYDAHHMDGNYSSIYPDDPLFDISQIELGYFNKTGNNKEHLCALFAKRNPNKRYKQGTSDNYIYSTQVDGQKDHSYGVSTKSKDLLKALDGEFPSLSSLTKAGSYALSLDVAVKIDSLGAQTFYYRTVPVAIKIPGSPLHILPDSTNWVVHKILGGFV